MVVNVGKLVGLVFNIVVILESLMEVGIVISNDGFLKVLGNGELVVVFIVYVFCSKVV